MRFTPSKTPQSFNTAGNTTNLSEYLDEPEKFSRTRNLLEVHEQTLYYFPEFGVDKSLIGGGQPIQYEAMQGYIRQRAFTFGIVLISTPIGEAQQDFSYNMNFIVEV
jgi:hypothetical protein